MFPQRCVHCSKEENTKETQRQEVFAFTNSDEEVGKAAQEPLKVVCWLWDVSCLSYDMLHQKGHFRQRVPVLLPCWSCPQALPGHGQGWVNSGQQMSGCEKVSIYSAGL